VCVCALPVYKQGLVHRARGVPQEDAVPGGCARAAAGTRWPAVSVCLRLSHGPATVDDGGGDHVCVVSVLIPSPPPPSYPSHPPCKLFSSSLPTHKSLPRYYGVYNGTGRILYINIIIYSLFRPLYVYVCSSFSSIPPTLADLRRA